MIFVRSRKYKSVVDDGLRLMDGLNPVYDLSRYHIGDKFSLFVNITRDQFEEMQNMSVVGLRVYGDPTSDPHTTLPFRIVEIEHFAGYRQGGRVSLSGSNIYLEAESGYWEDVYEWVINGERPKWAGEPEAEQEAAGEK
jgi:hypothetical protein